MLGQVVSLTYAAAGTKTVQGGRYLRLLSADGALTLTFYDDSGQPLGEFVGVLGGFAVDAALFQEKIGLTSAIFGRVDIYSATAQTVVLVVSRVPVDYDRLTGSITTTTSQGATISDPAAVAVTAAATALLAAGSGRRSVRFRNAGANSVAIIGAAGTYAAAAILLAPGEVWIESEAADAAWYGICAAGLTSTVNLQVVS